MKRIMYIENKSNGIDGEGRIGLVELSKSKSTYKYNGKNLKKVRGYKYNCINEETGEKFWVSGPKKNGTDKLYGGVVQIDENIREEYWTRIRNLPQNKNKNSYNS